MTEEYGHKLDRITESLEYLLRREKMAELCPPNTCGENGICTLSEHMATSYCQCYEGWDGKRCDISGVCLIKHYRFSQNNTDQPFPYRCDIGGSFFAVQFNESGGYCVTHLHTVIPGYNRTDKDDVNSRSCQCARLKYWVQEYGEVEERVTTCKSNGDYAEISCDEETCCCQNHFGHCRGWVFFPPKSIELNRERCHMAYNYV